MLAQLARRVVYTVPILLGVALVCFALVHIAPGDPLVSVLPPDERQAAGTVAVPAGLQEVSIVLEPQRAMGGRLAAGDEVGVIVSKSEGETHAVLHFVLVTQIQGAPASATAAHVTGGIAVRRIIAASSGVKTTYRPVTKPLMLAGVWARPAVCRICATP